MFCCDLPIIDLLTWLLSAENLAYFSNDIDLNIAHELDADTWTGLSMDHLNMIAVYMLHTLAESQSMANLAVAFRNARNMERFLSEQFSGEDDVAPILTRQTVAYAIYLSVQSVCFRTTDEMLKGKPASTYERALADFEKLSDPTWRSLLESLLIPYVRQVTCPEGPAPSAPTFTKLQSIASDSARKAARAAAAAAAAASEDGGDGGIADDKDGTAGDEAPTSNHDKDDSGTAGDEAPGTDASPGKQSKTKDRRSDRDKPGPSGKGGKPALKKAA